MAGKYEAQGTGLHDWVTRKNVYTAAIVVAAIIVAGLIFAGIINLDQVQSFIDLVVHLVGIFAGVGILVVAALARNNVQPPAASEVLDNVRAHPEGTHGA